MRAIPFCRITTDSESLPSVTQRQPVNLQNHNFSKVFIAWGPEIESGGVGFTIYSSSKSGVSENDVESSIDLFSSQVLTKAGSGFIEITKPGPWLIPPFGEVGVSSSSDPDGAWRVWVLLI